MRKQQGYSINDISYSTLESGLSLDYDEREKQRCIAKCCLNSIKGKYTAYNIMKANEGVFI